MTKIIIAGGNGLVGSRLRQILKHNGYQVGILSRNPHTVDPEQIFWDPEKKILNPDSISDASCIINLAGSAIAGKRFTPEHKASILDSRIQSTQLLVNALNSNPGSCIRLIQASAVGIYGAFPVYGISETGNPGTDFLAGVCKDWEAEAHKLNRSEISLAIVRIGVVLSAQGGYLKEIGSLARLGLAAPFGSGKMQTPWIHVDDLCEIIHYLIKNQSLTGTYNAVAPNPESNKVLTKLICKALHRPQWLPGVPPFILKLMVGEMARMLLADQNISSQKIQETGFTFKFTRAENAINNLIAS